MNDLLKEALTSNSQAIDSRINEIYGEFADPDTREVRDAELYSLTAGGKRIRAFLVNEFCRACGGNVLDSLDFAVAIEMMHTFSLIHDDLPCMDNDDMRRGKPTSHIMMICAEANPLRIRCSVKLPRCLRVTHWL